MDLARTSRTPLAMYLIISSEIKEAILSLYEGEKTPHFPLCHDSVRQENLPFRVTFPHAGHRMTVSSASLNLSSVTGAG